MRIFEIFKTQIKNNNLSHAYLVFGLIDIDGIMKILQIKKTDLFLLSENPIKINHIRQLIRWSYLKPHSSPRKLAIIESVECLTLEAANATLKILEEPPAHSIIILQTQRYEKILPTIVSRCQIIKEKIFKKDEKSTENSKHFFSPEEIARKTIKERFDYSQKILEEENLDRFLNLSEEYFRQKLLKSNDAREILRLISKARGLLSTNISVKLLLENLLLRF